MEGMASRQDLRGDGGADPRDINVCGGSAGGAPLRSLGRWWSWFGDGGMLKL